MNYLLVADIGNTNITIGIFSNTEIISIWRISSDLNQTDDEFSLKLPVSKSEIKFRLLTGALEDIISTETEAIEKTGNNS